jgi:sialidase-1
VVFEEGGEADITIGNPCPIVERDNGTIHLLFCRNNQRLFYTKSDDCGATWTTPEEITGLIKDFDFPAVRIGTGPVHGIEMAHGRLVAPVWLCNAMADAKGLSKEYRSGVLYSDDSGRSWKAGGFAPPTFKQLNESTVFEQADGSLVLNMRDSGLGFRAITTSVDAGLHWSAPVAERQLPCPVCQGSTLRLSDHEVLFSNPAGANGTGNTGKRRVNLTIRRSIDDGKTWPNSRVIHAGPSGYSDLALTQDGDILCVYECGEKQYNERIRFARFNRQWLQERQEP